VLLAAFRLGVSVVPIAALRWRRLQPTGRKKLRFGNRKKTATMPYNQAMLMPQSCRKKVELCRYEIIYRRTA
jgi:hypothetical protein